ncbi:three-Cys-motif partner protein TcmP [Anaerolinea thermophila]|uniref:GMT-like wHTH domain-containing protein n=1 Tax=Anaerolinea thermophila (strain DSM 14523 / JCM 11388 / NBRC 100420 / UNI-1) TaxID=926569 RepID=E8MYS3_ANATU|nr:three-Cys-motif partner protein TcmP [Anaerolinea thermophila]BAJ64409.1 hypothetical protein ANT_23830 [Anaerolinea thermophila UNI-1]
MAPPQTKLWKIDPHTKAKHEILRRYLGAWFGILGQKIPRIVYIDGFCGPGEYEDGEPGSPLIALQQARPLATKYQNTEFVFIFIDERKDRIENLESKIRSEQYPQNMLIFPINGTFEEKMSELFSDLSDEGALLAPTFVFIDPFGFSGIPFDIVAKFLSNPKTEIFINIMVDSINRFLDHPNPEIKNHIIRMFGTSKVTKVLSGSGDRFQALRCLYQEQLLTHAKFVRYFEMRDQYNQPIYYLFFASSHRLGHLKMKEAFWKVDPQTGYLFSDATDPNQLVLFQDAPIVELANILAKKFCGQTVTTNEIIHDFVEDQTPYTASHAKKALSILENEQKIKVYAYKMDGSPRIRNSFPDGVSVEFLV